MKELLTAIVTWLSVNSGLPASYDLPQVRLASAVEIARIHGANLAGTDPTGGATEYQSVPHGQREVVSLYDSRRRLILLPEGWTGRTPAELSMLVHEMVHHLQAVAGARYACPGEREKAAYAAQEKWLRLFGRTLEQDFEIDGMTLLVTTSCGF